MRHAAAVIAWMTLAAPGIAQEGEGWRPLFNGKDLEGWDTWLGKPHRSVEVPGLKRTEKGDYLEPVGLNKDPKGVYSVVDFEGYPAIRISGEIWGALTTKEEFENYHLRLEVKWGRKKWPPRENAVRDSGLLYHCVGPHGAQSSFWMKSFECQIQENDFGDFFSVAGVIVDVEAERLDPANPKSPWVYRKGAPKQTGVTSRIVRHPRMDRLTEWNTVEVYAVGPTAVHVVNGTPNLVLTGLRHRADGKEVPLTRGRIQIQSEGAEVYYRNIAIRPISEIPRRLLE
ncbi:MAG TPA: DUF1080 domain-containing protein [Planctomycetota bacterium]|nr:DUF1080 domain-containing protein [Planctomycetota bacterium]